MSGHRPLPDTPPSSVRNRRVDRTRGTILAAFRDLLLRDGYRAVSVAKVVARADVGRSTFYEHFENKEALLRESMRPLLAVLATAVCERPNSAAIRSIVEHVFENRSVARALSGSLARDLSVAFLGELIAEHFQRGRLGFAVPLPLKARQIAESQLGLLRAWIEMPGDADASAIATEITMSSQALREH